MASLRGKSAISKSVVGMTNNVVQQSPIKDIALDKIVPYHREGGNTPIFRDYNDERLLELADSLRTHGQMDSIIVFASTVYPNKYEVLSGKQRTRAAMYNAETYPDAPKTIRAEVLDTQKVSENDFQYGDLIYVNTNVYRREELFASELGMAYEMQAKAMKHQGANTGAKHMLDEIASKSHTSVSFIRNVRRIIPEHCIQEFIKMVDDKVLPMSPTALYLTRFGNEETNLKNQTYLYDFVFKMCNSDYDRTKEFFKKNVNTPVMSHLKDSIMRDRDVLLREEHLKIFLPKEREKPTYAFKSPSKKKLQEIIPAEYWGDPDAAVAFLVRAKKALEDIELYKNRFGEI